MEICDVANNQILDVNQTEVGSQNLLSDHPAVQIAPTDPHISEEKDKNDHTFRLRFDALYLPCQTVVQKFNAIEKTTSPSIEKSDSSIGGHSVVPMTSELTDPHEEILSHFGLPAQRINVPDSLNSETDNCAETASFDGDSVLGCVAAIDHPVFVSGFRGSVPLQTPDSGAVCARNFKTSQTTSGLLGSSSKTSLSPETSHHFKFAPCESLATTSTESIKPTEGPSDDILSRSIIKGLETEAFSDRCNHPENHVNTSLSPPPDNLIMTRAIIGTDTWDEASHRSLTFEHQLKQSHEETVVPFVSDHFKIPSSPPLVAIEYLQSGPYFEPATIFREHNAHFSTEVVGAQYLPSSSPPSSPSMNLNYAPSSSPLPGSSPVERTSQISPPSSPTHPDEYDQVNVSTSGGRQEFYAAENYSIYPDYSTEHAYYKAPDRGGIQGAFMPAGPSSLGDPSYPLGFLNHPMAPPLNHEHYNHANRANFLPVQHTFESIEPPISNTRHDNTGYEINTYTSIPVPQEYSVPDTDTPYYEQRPVNDNAIASSSTAVPQNLEPLPTNVIPRPKRPTPAGQRQQQKKLSKPFRSPVLHTPVRLAPKPPASQTPPLAAASKSADIQTALSDSFKTKGQESNADASSSSQAVDTKVKHRTPRAASQFKSPLPTTSTPLDEATLVRLTPTIQSLERKLQLLRRALKVREDVQEEVLEGLVKKWSEAGREAAWEVWDVVKDNANSEEPSGSSQSKGKKRSIDENWGWDESGDQKKPKMEKERNWGWDVVPVSEREDGDVLPEKQHEEVAETQEEAEGEEGAPQPTLGTMLIQLGIAPETLGWDEEEGNFVDR